jgi:hypothetical protein
MGKGGIDSLERNSGEIMGCGHGGRGFRVEMDGQCITMTTLLIDITRSAKNDTV